MKNVGQTDKKIRIIVGIILLSIFFFGKGNAKYFGILGIIPLFTAFTGKCGLYKLFGINTKEDK